MSTAFGSPICERNVRRVVGLRKGIYVYCTWTEIQIIWVILHMWRYFFWNNGFLNWVVWIWQTLLFVYVLCFLFLTLSLKEILHSFFDQYGEWEYPVLSQGFMYSIPGSAGFFSLTAAVIKTPACLASLVSRGDACMSHVICRSQGSPSWTVVISPTRRTNKTMWLWESKGPTPPMPPWPRK